MESILPENFRTPSYINLFSKLHAAGSGVVAELSSGSYHRCPLRGGLVAALLACAVEAITDLPRCPDLQLSCLSKEHLVTLDVVLC